MKVPAILATGIVCLAVGIGLGALGMANSDMFVPKPPEAATPPEGGQGAEHAHARSARWPGWSRRTRQHGPGGRWSGRWRGPGRRPGAQRKSQLATLLAKLDLLTKKPLTVTLTDEERTKLAELIKGLGDQDALDDDDAKKRLDAVLEIVKDDKETLEAAGYRWPGQGGGRPPANAANAPNPFKEGENATHLKSLQESLEKPKGN